MELIPRNWVLGYLANFRIFRHFKALFRMFRILKVLLELLVDPLCCTLRLRKVLFRGIHAVPNSSVPRCCGNTTPNQLTPIELGLKLRQRKEDSEKS